MRGRIAAVLCSAGLGAGLLAGGATSAAADPTPVAGQAAAPATATTRTTGSGSPGGSSGWDRIPALVSDATPSVVAVLTDRGQGSGVIWSSDGVIVTNHHVIADASSIQVEFSDGGRIEARVVASDERSDLAVLRVDRSGLPAADFESDVPPIGSLAIAIGNSLGFENSVSVGVVAGVSRAIPGAASQAPALVDLVQTDAAISPGNSGGALIGADGKVIGVSVAFIPPTSEAVSIGFAIPAATVRDVVQQLLDGGDVTYVFFGARLATITRTVADQFGLEGPGVAVRDLVDGGPAAQAGIRTGDVIVRVDDRRIQSVEELLGLLREHQPGDTLSVVVVRDGDRPSIDVTLGTAPD